MKITPLGDSALTVRVRTEFASDPEGCLRDVTSVLRRLQTANLPGVVEVTPAFTTVTVFYDPAQVVASGGPVDGLVDWLIEKIRAVIEGGSLKKDHDPSARSFEIPVCYDPEFAPDLPLVAAHTTMKPEEVVAAHSSGNYRVGCVGFAPGFPFLLGLPSALATPRRATPRTKVAAGSVAIGGVQTGIYPQPSPGGWNLIGRTPLRLFDVTQDQPSLLSIGDKVRFRPITRAEFEAFAK